MKDKLLTTKEALKVVPFKEPRLLKLMREGKLKANRLMPENARSPWRIWQSDLDKFMEKNFPKGSP